MAVAKHGLCWKTVSCLLLWGERARSDSQLTPRDMVCVLWCRSAHGGGWLPARLLWKPFPTSLHVLCCVEGRRDHGFSPSLPCCVAGFAAPRWFPRYGSSLTASGIRSVQAFVRCRIRLPSPTEAYLPCLARSSGAGMCFAALIQVPRAFSFYLCCLRIVCTVLLSALPSGKCGLV